MEYRFLGQPFDGQANLADFIEHATSNRFRNLRIAVAWAKWSGIGRILDHLDEFRSRGGHVQMIIGVSEGGATKEGLELALAAIDECYVFHDPRRTFHPKVYLGTSDSEFSLIVGSSNLTAGGLSWNYEASLWTLGSKKENAVLLTDALNWFDRLLNESDSCIPLTKELIEKMVSSADLQIGTEFGSRRVQKRNSGTPEDSDSKVEATISGLFQPVRKGLRPLPKLSTSLISSTKGANSTIDSPVEKLSSQILNHPLTGEDAELRSDNVVSRWFKKLDNTAAQQVKSPKSNPTGNLRLSQEEATINHKIYFRDQFFRDLPWTPTENKKSEQEVIVSFCTWVNGHNLGIQDLRVSHDPNRIAGQGNVPTVLHWGPLSPLLRATSYIGFFVNLERLSDRNYNLIISRTPRGEYLF